MIEMFTNTCKIKIKKLSQADRLYLVLHHRHLEFPKVIPAQVVFVGC